MNVVLVSSGSPQYDRFPPGGGIQYQIYHTAKEFHRQGHDPTVITRSHQERSMEGVGYEEIDPFLNDEIMSRFDFSRRAKQWIESNEVDLVLAYERFSASLLTRGNYPVLFFTSNPDAMTFYRSFAINRHPLNRLLFPMKLRLEEWVMRHADRVIALNESIEAYLHERMITHTEVIPNAVNLDDYRAEGDDEFILFAGRLNQVKGCELLLEAFAEVAERESGVELVFAGDGELKEKLDRRSHSLGIPDRVRFPGWLEKDKLISYYSRCKAFVLPSVFEMSPVSLLEAMASGKPVIAGDIMGPRDIVTDGEDGLLFRSRDPADLADTIQKVIEDDEYRSTLGSNARATVCSRHSFAHVTDRVAEISAAL